MRSICTVFSNRQIEQFVGTCSAGFLNFLISLVAAIGSGEIDVEDSVKQQFLKTKKRLFKALRAKKTTKRVKRELFRTNPLAVRHLLEASIASLAKRHSREETKPVERSPSPPASAAGLSTSTPSSSAPFAPPPSAEKSVQAEVYAVPRESAEVGEVGGELEEVDCSGGWPLQPLAPIDEPEEVYPPPRDLFSTLLAESPDIIHMKQLKTQAKLIFWGAVIP